MRRLRFFGLSALIWIGPIVACVSNSPAGPGGADGDSGLDDVVVPGDGAVDTVPNGDANADGNRQIGVDADGGITSDGDATVSDASGCEAQCADAAVDGANETGTDVTDGGVDAVADSGAGEGGSEDGGLLLSATDLEFYTGCGSPTFLQAPAQSFTITNTGLSPISWAGSLSNSAGFTFAPTGTTLEPAAMVMVTVTPTAIPENPLPVEANGTITITGSTTAQVISLHEHLNSGFFNPLPPDLDFGDSQVGIRTAFKLVTPPDPVSYAGAFAFSTPSLSFNIVPVTGQGGQQTGWNIAFDPTSTGPIAATVTISSPDPDRTICPPNTFTVRGNGTSPVACGDAGACASGVCISGFCTSL